MLFEQQAKEMQEITARWISDNKGSWLSRNVRPLVLLFLIVSTVLMIFIDAGVVSFEVKDSWVDLLQLTLITVISAYFGGRSFEKIKIIMDLLNHLLGTCGESHINIYHIIVFLYLLM